MPRQVKSAEEVLATKRESNRRWAQANREKVRDSNKKYEAENREKIAARKAAYRANNPGKFRERNRLYRINNPHKDREYSAARYAADKDGFKKQIAAWRAAHPDELAESIRRTQKKRRPKMREYVRRRFAEDMQFRMATLLRNRLRKALSRGQRGGLAIKHLGCDAKQAMAHLESKFRDGMSWENMGKWHIDHIRPLASFDLTKEEQVAEACHFSNLQPLWGKENQSKGCRLMAA